MCKIKKQLFWAFVIIVLFSQTGQSQTYIKPFIGLNAFNISGDICQGGFVAGLEDCYNGYDQIQQKLDYVITYGLQIQKKISANYYINVLVGNRTSRFNDINSSFGGNTFFQFNALNLNFSLAREISKFKVGLGVDILYISNYQYGADHFKTRSLNYTTYLDGGISIHMDYLIRDKYSIALNMRKGLIKKLRMFYEGVEDERLKPSNFAELTFGYRFKI